MPTPAPSSTRPPPVAIIVSRYNQTTTYRLRDGAVAAYVAAGGRESDLAIIEAPGAFEIPMIVQEAALIDAYAGIVAIGCIVKGETDHDRYLADAVSKALLEIAMESGVPVGLGVLTVNTIEQAVARSGGVEGGLPGNKGAEAMNAVLSTLNAIEAMATAADQKKSLGVRFVLPEGTADKAPVRGATSKLSASSRRAAPRRAKAKSKG